MTRSSTLAIALFASVTAGCGGTSSTGSADSGGGASDAPGDTLALPAVDGGYCCVPDPSPGCCMHMGGWSSDPGGCLEVCDGIPLPGDPSWHLGTDSHGCQVWMYTPGGSLCGEATVDSGHDAPIESGSSNPPGCPASWSLSLCGGSCSPVGLSCYYGPPGNGDGLFCASAADGGDAGSDGGGAGMWRCGV